MYEEECIFCKNLINKKVSFGDFYNHNIFDCPLCGIYIFCYEEIDNLFNNPDAYIDKSNVASYMYYHKIDYDVHKSELRNYIGSSKSLPYFQNSNRTSFSGNYTIIDKSFMTSLRSIRFSEKESYLLKDIYHKREVSSDIAVYTIPEIESAAFVIKTNLNIWENNHEQYLKLLKSLEADEKIQILDDGKTHQQVIIKITTKGIKIIENGDKSMDKNIPTIQKQIIMGNGSTYVEEVSGHNNTIGTVNNSGIDFTSILSLVDKIESICNENKDKQLQPEIIESINDNLSDIRSYVSQKNETGIMKGLKTIRGLLMSASVSIAANMLTPEIQTMITSIKNCIGA